MIEKLATLAKGKLHYFYAQNPEIAKHLPRRRYSHTFLMEPRLS
jgi:hypothetical protein